MKKYFCIVLLFFMYLVGCDGGISMNSYQTYKNSEKYLVGDLKVEGISEITIDWIYGSVNIEKNNDQKLTIAEKINETKEEYKMHYFLENGHLDIKFMGANCQMPVKNIQKDLLIKIPNDIQELDINVVSAKVTLDSVATQELEIDSVSGEIEVSNLKSETVSIDGVSGKILIDDTVASKLDIENTSGQVLIKNVEANVIDITNVSGKNSLDNCSINTSLEIESTSGGIEAILNKCPSTIDFDTVSGSINLVTPTLVDYLLKVKTNKGTTTEEKGNKTNSITLESTSGKITYKLN